MPIHEMPVPEGCDLIPDEPDVLNLDLDNGATPYWVSSMVWDPLFGRVKSIRIWLSRGGNVHAQVRLTSPMPFKDRLALQEKWGSDSARSCIDLIKLPSARRNVLFKPKRA